MTDMTNCNIERRSLLRGAAALAVLAPMAAVLAACGFAPAGEPAGDAGAGSAEAGKTDAGAAAEGARPGSVLVAYFSATGNTAGVASAIADHLGADTFEIQPVAPYTSEDLNYNDDASRASVEHAEDARPELVQTVPDGFDAYDTVFVGYPIWWGDAALPAKTFVEGNDFSGKTVVPFCTSTSSGIGGSGAGLAELAGTGTWAAGERFGGGASADAVASWLDGIVYPEQTAR